MDFGNILKHLRKEKKMTQQQLANQLGVSKSVVSFYENHERIPSPEVLVKIAAVFGVSTDYLLGVKRNKSIDVSELCDDDVQVVISVVDALKKKK